jgi:hypothetical protein
MECPKCKTIWEFGAPLMLCPNCLPEHVALVPETSGNKAKPIEVGLLRRMVALSGACTEK